MKNKKKTLYSFMAWLSTQDKMFMFTRFDKESTMAKLIDEYCELDKTDLDYIDAVDEGSGD